jgi:hypothetical protein
MSVRLMDHMDEVLREALVAPQREGAHESASGASAPS